jgi:hypothetical protein
MARSPGARPVTRLGAVVSNESKCSLECSGADTIRQQKLAALAEAAQRGVKRLISHLPASDGRLNSSA